MSFDLPVEPDRLMTLVVTYNGGILRRTPAEFDILADGEGIKHEVLSAESPEGFFDVEYSLPARIVKGKTKVTVRFQAKEGKSAATVFGIRMIRADRDALEAAPPEAEGRGQRLPPLSSIVWIKNR